MVLKILLFAIFLISSSQAVRAEDEWYPFIFTQNPDPNSPFNMSKILLDAPAGKHGFLKVKGAKFYFSDGTPAKFWGTNLCFSACFPTKEEAEFIAERIAFFGFNAVRLHHMDSSLQPKGIFQDSSTLSKEQLEKLDYLIYQLKERGIYVNINLLVSRKFSFNDGVFDADKLGKAAKPVSMFDRSLITLQKKYAKDLLAHQNPYTKMRYCDDPAIAFIEITNENSLFLLEEQKLPDYYKYELNKLRNEFETGNPGAADKDFYAYLENEYFNEMTKFLKNQAGIRVPITGIGGYRNAGDVKAQKNCGFIDKHAYWDHPKFPNISWDENDFRMTNKSALLDPYLGVIGKIIQGHRDKSKPYTVSEWNHCYPNAYAYETPLLLSYFANKNNWQGLFQFAFSHANEPETGVYAVSSYFDILANPQQLILNTMASYIFLQSLKAKENYLEKGVFKFESKKLNAAVGFIKEKRISLGLLSVDSRQDGAVILSSADNLALTRSKRLILIVLGKVKNDGSYWKDSRFNWGKAPVLLQRMGTVISLKLKNEGYKVYALDEKGARKKEINSEYQTDTLTFSTSTADTPWFEISSL
ncbi:MAG: hypothetical protein AB1481_07155 [Candidatus Omnitrophota bacterium]